MARPSTALIARCVVPIAALLSGVLVWHASNAAFSSSTTNEGNQLTAGEVVLGDDDSGSARFTVSNLKPNQSTQRCIRVTSDSNVPTSVKLYLRDVSADQYVAEHAQLAVEEVESDSASAGSANGCGNLIDGTLLFTDRLAEARERVDFTTGAGTWQPTTAGQSQLYRITFTLHPTIDDRAQGAEVGMDFVWEARSA